MILTVCPFVLLASAVDAIGGGGGLISLPAYLLTGISPALAGGSNKMSAFVGSLTAMLRFMRSGMIRWKPALLAVFGALPGAFLGAQVLSFTPDIVARILLLAIIPVMAVLLFLKKKPVERAFALNGKTILLCLFIGLSVGFYDGFFGPGTGTLLIMMFTYWIGMDMISASASAKVVNLSSNVAALIAHILNGNVLFALAIPAMFCSVAGGYIGAVLVLKRGAGFIRLVMLCVMLFLLVKLVYDTVTGGG